MMGLQHVELASLLGVHEMTFVNWETGNTKPSGRRLNLVKKWLPGPVLGKQPDNLPKSAVCI